MSARRLALFDHALLALLLLASRLALAAHEGGGHALPALAWGVWSSTAHRVRRGEGALLAINLSLIFHHGDAVSLTGLVQAAVSALAILVM